MNTPKEDKLKKIHDIDKEVDIHTLLEELLPKMGLTNVHVTHERGNHSEDGKDLICSFRNSVDGTTEWWAFVVKKGTVAGNSATIQDIIAQTSECFDYEYKNIIRGLRFYVNKVKVVTNNHFSNEAERKIRESAAGRNANIDFWDDEKLIQFIDQYYPLYWVKGTHQYKLYMEHFLEHIKLDSMAKALWINSAKIKKILEVAIEPRLSERIEKKDGSFEWASRSISSVVKLPSNTIIIGEPGAGKTTLFKKLSKEIIDQNALRNDAEFYPVILTFNNVKNAGYDIIAAIRDYFNSDWLRIAVDVDEIIRTNQCVIFVDALDELPLLTEKERALQAVNDFNNEHPDIKIICSSRPSDYLFENCSALGFNYMEIAPVNQQQIKTFLNYYFSGNTIKCKRLLKSLKDTGILDKLPKTPMTLALITILFDENEVEIPATITDLYRQFVDLLLGRNTTENTIEIIEVGVRHRLLCFIAHKLHMSNQQSVSMDVLGVWIAEYAEPRGLHFDVDAYVEDYVNNTGLLFYNDRNEVQFKHLSFQEYFTAFDIYNYSEQDREIIIKNFNSSWWQNVAIFYAGMSKDSSFLLNDILHNSIPTNLYEMVSNTGGMGLLLQALYNTPMDDRIKGVERGLSNMCDAITTIKDNPDRYSIWHHFSEYGLMQLFGALFSVSNWSITLVETLRKEFGMLFEEIEDKRTDLQQTQLEFKMLMLCQILASDDFRSFSEFRQLVENSRSNNLSLFASLDIHRRRVLKKLGDVAKNDEDFAKASKKLLKKGLSLGYIEDLVNVPLLKALPSSNANKE